MRLGSRPGKALQPDRCRSVAAQGIVHRSESNARHSAGLPSATAESPPLPLHPPSRHVSDETRATHHRSANLLKAFISHCYSLALRAESPASALILEPRSLFPSSQTLMADPGNIHFSHSRFPVPHSFPLPTQTTTHTLLPHPPHLHTHNPPAPHPSPPTKAWTLSPQLKMRPLVAILRI